MKNKSSKKYLHISIKILIFGIFCVSLFNFNDADKLFFKKIAPVQSVVAAGDTGGLVPCGHGSNSDNRCTLCDLFVGIDRIIRWGRNILVAVALTALTVGGIMYIVSAGNQQMMETAKNLITQALTGVVIVLGAWLIINTVLWLAVTKDDMGVGAGNWWNFDCSGQASGGSSTDTSDTEGFYRATLEENGILVNHEACTSGQVSGCTNVGGLRDDTLQGVVDLANNSEAPVVITGGSEGGHASGTYSHANGYKVDIRTGFTVDNYITNNYQNIGVRSDGATVYKDGNNYYARENDHWDICYNCESPI
ncbi:MAG TPA: hypothetical protein ENJ27_00575 [Candidatus Moranbacteria bacterium]|nr:hypothetical protein [Candidatus Moranbacteria bacterium]